MKNKLTIIRGCPGSGKSTYAKTHYSCLIIENDMFHMKNGKYEYNHKNMPQAIKWCKTLCQNTIENGMDCVVANTFVKKAFVDIYKKIAETYGAEFEVIRCDNDFGNVHNVPQFVLDSMHDGFEDYPGETIVKETENV